MGKTTSGPPLSATTGARRLRLPLALVMVVGFGGLLLVAVASVLFLGLRSAGENTFTLLADKADLALAAVDVRVRHQLDPVRDEATAIARLIERGDLDPAKPERLIDTIRGALAATPQVMALGFADTRLNGAWVTRQDGELHQHVARQTDDPEIRTAVTEAERQSGPMWIGPLWEPGLKSSILVLRVPVRRDGVYQGMVAAAVALSDLSRFLSQLYLDMGINAFVLYDRDHVLAHQALPYLQFDFSNRPQTPPLPRLSELDDPALAALWDEAGSPFAAMENGAKARVAMIGGERHVFLIGQISGYGEKDWIAGIDLPMDEVAGEIRRLWNTTWVGSGILLVSVATALWLGRSISRQVSRLALAADRIRALDFTEVPLLPDSRLSELARAAAAFNAMIAGLKWFETFVPKGLVLRLMHRDHGAGHHYAWEERVVTVMFTDIRGFSTLAENRSPAETAQLLNDHFTVLSECIEAEGGTVDKFIGDAVMAFWGAPDEQPDHAARAVRAARAIARAIHEDNRRRLAARLAPVRMGIGIHTGPTVVGNIGSASRINYTIVGDTVNTAARIEELGSTLQGPAETIVLVSETSARAAQGEVPLRPLGRFTLRGRNGTVEISRLEV